MERAPSTGEWLPTPQPRMPSHHSSRLAFQDLAALPGLLGARDQRLRFVREQISHRIDEVPGERSWRAEYIARVDAICIPGPATTGP